MLSLPEGVQDSKTTWHQIQGAFQANTLAELNALRPEIDPGRANDDLAEQLGWKEALAVSAKAIAETGALGAFSTMCLTNLGMHAAAATAISIVLATIATLSILYIAKRRT